MNAEELEIARRLVACKGWAWIPGMRTASRGRVCLVDDGLLYLANNEARFSGASDERECVPDLSDDLTRLGVIEVMQRAWGAPYSYPEPVELFDSDGVVAGASWRVRVPGRKFEGDTELAALLAALEAAP